MVDQITQAVNVIIPWKDETGEIEDENEKISHIFADKANTRPIYLIKRRKDTKLIQQQLKTENRILLRTLNTYAHYSCKITEMQQQILQYMTDTGAYSLIMEVQCTNQHDIEEHLNNMHQQIIYTLNNLLHDRSITLLQWKRMKPDQSERKVDSLYFLPDTRKVKYLRSFPLIYILIFCIL